jgi:hypothetical protein
LIYCLKMKLFRPASKDWNFYRDLILLWPIMLMSYVAAAELFDPHATMAIRIALLSAVIVLIFFAREKLLLLYACTGCFAFQSAYVFFRYGFHWTYAVIAFVCSVISISLAWVRRRHRICYDWPNEMGGFELLLMLGSIVLTFTALYLLTRYR